jgi:two-component system NtrC family response regulator
VAAGRRRILDVKLDAAILVVDDDASQRAQLAGFLRDLGADVGEAGDGREALDLLPRIGPDVVITDLRMRGMDGHGLLREIREVNPEIGVIIVTAYGTVEDAVACLKDGAADYLLKPLDLDEVEHLVRREVGRRHLERENRELRRRLGSVESVAGIVTAGGAMAEVLSMVKRVSATSASVLILGETGTGKELVARTIHAASPRSAEPFIAVNASALSPALLESELFGHEKGAFTGADRRRTGRFEASTGGTLFLDEIGDLPAEVQVKLLRVLQEKSVERVGSNRPIPVDVRLIAATHRDLPGEIEKGRFREDLYYRLAVVSIELPPLRRRRADIPLLVEHFIARFAGTVPDGPRRVSREAMDLLVRYDHPGNVRELENIVQRSMVLARGDQITTDDLPATVLGASAETAADGSLDSGASLPARVAALEKSAIEEALEAEEGNQSAAARRLGISERALRYKLAKFRGSG